MIKLSNITVSPYNKDSLEKIVADILKTKKEEIKDLKILKKSIDARHKNDVKIVYEVCFSSPKEKELLKNDNVKKYEKEEYKRKKINKKTTERPVIIGSGPCGLFCALTLAEAGLKPIIIERGEKIEDRVKTVDEFWNTGILKENSNVSFGEGGAGTFSDGKLNTLTSDKEHRIDKVFNTFVECGANEEIMYDNKPHIGTNVLRKVIVNLRNKIISLGGEFRFNTLLTDILIKDNKINKVILEDSIGLDTNYLVLAIGHSARDTIKMLYVRGLKMESKPFAIGVRIQHKQDVINNQYGKFKDVLPNASYKLTYQTKASRGVYTFCMCPGGYVVNSSSEVGKLIVNGMSNYERDTENANSAVVVTVGKEDFGPNPLDGLEYQRTIEGNAYRKGNGKIPVQLLGDYVKNTISTEFKEVKPIFKGDYSFANLNEIFPYYINDAIKEALLYFDKKIHGFSRAGSILAGVETRTSSAVKINRDELYESNIKGIYPAGEGCGYSGGITTSAVDGIRVAEKIIESINR